MKKKFLSLVSLMLAVVMMMPAAVFAEGQVGDTGVSTFIKPDLAILKGTEPAENITLYTGSSTKNSVQLSVPEGYNVMWNIATADENKVSVVNGLVTAKADEACDVEITVIDRDDPTNTESCVIHIEPRACTEVTVTGVTDVNTKYVSGQKFNTTGLTVNAKYNDADAAVPVTNYTIEVQGEAANRPFKVTDTYVKVVVDGKKSEPINVTITERTVSSVKVLYPKTSYTEGDKIKDLEVEVTFNDGEKVTMTSGFDISITEALKTTDTSYYVTYQNVKSAEVNIKVAAKSTTTPPTTDTPTTTEGCVVEYTGSIPKIYEVGEKIDFSKVTALKLVKNGTTTFSTTATILASLEKSNTAFTSAQIGNNVTYTFNVKYGGDTYVLALTGLTVIEKEEDENKDDEDGPYEIRDVEMLKDKYEVGYEFDLEDIDFVEVKWTRNGTAYEIEGKDLDDYDANPTIEVLDKDGDTKSRTYRDTIEEADVLTDRYGDKYVQLLLTFGEETYEFDVEVGSDPIQFIHRNKVIITYDDIEDALEATLEQDKDVDTDKFDLEDDVTTSRPITLKLGENAELDDDFEYDPAHPVIIDLNGYTLTIHTTTVDMSRKNDGNLTITNSSKTAGKVIYDDIEVTVTVAEDEELVFEYDAETVPGIYTVEVTWGQKGSVTSKPSMDKNDTIAAGVGTEITFTIKPVSGYQLDVIKADGKAVAASAYTKATNGTVTYKYKVGEANGKIEVAFKEIVVEKPAWKNPYNDVRSTASYLGAVEFVTENELMNGTSSTTFSPTKTMNRAMFVTVLGRLAGVDTSKYTKSSFIDVPLNSSTSWYAPYVEWANQNGIIQGYGNGKFGPMDEITHQQLYTIVYRYAVFVENVRFTPGTTTITVSDKNDIDSYAIDGVKFATAKDLLVTSGGKITPKSGALRWELATVLQLFCENVLGWEDAE